MTDDAQAASALESEASSLEEAAHRAIGVRERLGAEGPGVLAMAQMERASGLRRAAHALRCRGPLVEALEHLLEWADWQRRRMPAPSMNEPNSGAREEARAAIALAKDRP